MESKGQKTFKTADGHETKMFARGGKSNREAEEAAQIASSCLDIAKALQAENEKLRSAQ